MDDEKFIDEAIELFESCSGKANKYLVGVSNNDVGLVHVTSELITKAVYFSREYESHLRELTQGDVVIVHYLDNTKAKVVSKIPRGIKIVWLVFGAEFYNSSFYKGLLYQPHTVELLGANFYWQKKSIKSLFRNAYYFFRGKLPPSLVLRRAVIRMDYFSTPVPDEAPLFYRAFGFKAKYVSFRYGTLEGMVGNLLSLNMDLGRGVLIGNSNTPASNHADAFYFLLQNGVIDKPVVLPMSYGKNVVYKTAIKSLGEKMFSEFHVIDTFMERSAYINEVLGKCDIAIFNHNRQQAIGNIIISLWIGVKVFLSKESPTFHYFKRLGFYIYALQESSARDFYEKLSQDEVSHNRKLLRQEFGRSKVLAQVRDLIDLVTENGD